jgi:hypothetical protein
MDSFAIVCTETGQVVWCTRTRADAMAWCCADRPLRVLPCPARVAEHVIGGYLVHVIMHKDGSRTFSGGMHA